MIFLRLEGGLGNVMFQYSLGRHLALRHKTPLKYDIESFKTNPLGDYSFALENFTIDIRNNLLSPDESARFQRLRKKRGRRWFLYNALFADESLYVEERGFDFDPHVLDVGDNVYLHGWWQNEKYFASIRPILLEDFAFRDPLTGKNQEAADQISRVQSVSLHVRRLDFVTNPKTHAAHGELTKDYYDRAVARIAEQAPNLVLFVFSDDIPWVKEHFSFPFETVHIGWNRDAHHEDMRLMSMCAHHITANSAFSWWGAWLGTHPDKIVVSPERWIRDPRDKNDRVPADWIKLPN